MRIILHLHGIWFEMHFIIMLTKVGNWYILPMHMKPMCCLNQTATIHAARIEKRVGNTKMQMKCTC